MWALCELVCVAQLSSGARRMEEGSKDSAAEQSAAYAAATQMEAEGGGDHPGELEGEGEGEEEEEEEPWEDLATNWLNHSFDSVDEEEKQAEWEDITNDLINDSFEEYAEQVYICPNIHARGSHHRQRGTKPSEIGGGGAREGGERSLEGGMCGGDGSGGVY